MDFPASEGYGLLVVRGWDRWVDRIRKMEFWGSGIWDLGI